MDVYSRHVFRQVTSALLLILISLTMIVWMATALRQLKLVTTQGQSVFLFLKMTSLALPSLMGFIAPIALLIACLHILNRVNGDSELIVMNAGGATIWRIARPYLAIAATVTVFLYFITIYLQPYSLRTLRDYIVQVRTDLISQVLQAGQFSSPEKGLTFHIRSKSTKGDLLGLMIHDSRDSKQVITYLAERGVIRKDGDQASLVMHRGHIMVRRENAQGAEIIQFAQYAFDLTRFGPSGDPTKKKFVHYKPKESYTYELLNPDPRNSHYKRRPGKFRSELHERLVSPLYPLLFAMIAIAMIGQVRTTRQRSQSGVFIAFGLAVLLKVLGVAASNLVTKSASMAPLVYIVPVGSFIAIAFFAWASSGHRRQKQ